MEPRKSLLSSNARHFFDLFHEPFGSTNCAFFNLWITSEYIIMDISCDKTVINPMYHVEQINSTTDMCFRPFKMYYDMARICHYHNREQLRFTVLDNDTVLVEDLSPVVPPGTRMFFRTRSDEAIDEGYCSCRNALRDEKFYKKCSKYRDRVQAEFEAESWFKVELEGSTVEDRWIAVGLLLSACLATGLGLLWANGRPRQVRTPSRTRARKLRHTFLLVKFLTTRPTKVECLEV